MAGSNKPLQSWKLWGIQMSVALGLSLIFSALPLVFALTMDKSSLPLAVFMSWYSLFPAMCIFLAALLLNLGTRPWLKALGMVWISLAVWFILQYLFSALGGSSLIIAMLALPAVLSGNTMLFLVAGVISLALGMAFYFISRRTANPAPRPAAAWSAFAVMMAVMLVAMPVLMAALSNPAIPEPAGTPTREKVFGYIGDMYNMGERRTGSEADHKAISYLVAKLGELGFKDVRSEESTFDYWAAGDYSLTVMPAGGAAWQPRCFYVPYSGPAPAGGLTAEVVYLGNISKPDWQDVSGKIILVDIPATSISFNQMKLFSYMAYEPENQIGSQSMAYPVGWMLKYQTFYKTAEPRRPAGIIGILRDYPDFGKFTYYAPYDGELRHIPSMYMAQAEGDKLKAQLTQGAVKVKMVLEADVRPGGGRTSNVFALLPGKSPATLMIHSHHDSPFRSGVEDSSGVGMVLALAEYYARQPLESRPYTMLFMFTGSHMVGTPSNGDFVFRHSQDIVPRILYDLAIEHIANDSGLGSFTGEGVTPRGAFISENPVAVSLYATSVYDAGATRTLLFPTGGPLGVPTDAYPFMKLGIPIVSLISGPTWLFDESDTLGRVAQGQLAPLATMYIDFVSRLGATPEWLLHFNLTWFTVLLLAVVMSPLAAVFLAFRR